MRRRRGFTLLEVLAAAILGAMLMLVTAQVFHTALSAHDRLRDKAQDSSTLRRTFEMMGRDFHAAVLPPEDAGFTFGQATDQGAIQLAPFQFATANAEPLLQARAATETLLVQYFVDQDPRTNQPMLFRRTVAYPSTNQSSPFDADDAGIMPLMPGVTGVMYSYYSTDQQTWLDTWDGQTGLPTAVRVDLVIADKDPNAQPHQEGWVFNIPAAQFINDEANDAADAADSATTQSTNGSNGQAGGAGTGGTGRTGTGSTGTGGQR